MIKDNTHQAKVVSVELSVPTNDNPITPDVNEGGFTRLMISIDIVMKEEDATELYDKLLEIQQLDKNVYLIV